MLLITYIKHNIVEAIMALDYAILGFLSWNPMTGYDLKKRFTDTLFIPWSGNNNQIYRTLIRLNTEGLVTTRVEQPESGPARKIYTITGTGLTALKTWLLSTPELPADRNTFLIQLAWTERLETTHLLDMLKEYAGEAAIKVTMLKEQQKRRTVWPGRSPREELIWDRIAENRIGSLETERKWAEDLYGELENLEKRGPS